MQTEEGRAGRGSPEQWSGPVEEHVGGGGGHRLTPNKWPPEAEWVQGDPGRRRQGYRLNHLATGVGPWFSNEAPELAHLGANVRPV